MCSVVCIALILKLEGGMQPTTAEAVPRPSKGGQKDHRKQEY